MTRYKQNFLQPILTETTKRLILIKKEEDHKKILTSVQRENPKNDARNLSIVKGIRHVPQSTVVSLGNTDPSGYSEKVRAWIRETKSTDNADEGFFTKKIKPKNVKFWNDPNIPDSEFSIKSDFVDTRQKLPNRPNLMFIEK